MRKSDENKVPGTGFEPDAFLISVIEKPSTRGIVLFFFCFNNHFYFRAQLVGGFTLSDLLDKPWSQVSAPSPSGMCLHFYRAQAWFSIPTARRFSSHVANSRSRAFR